MTLQALENQLAGLKDNLKPHYRKRLKEMDQGYQNAITELGTWCDQSASTSSFRKMVEYSRKARPEFLRVGVYHLEQGKLPACVEFNEPHLCVSYRADRLSDARTLVQKLLLRISVDMAGDRPFVQHIDFSKSADTEELFPGLLNRQIPPAQQLSQIVEESVQSDREALGLKLPTRLTVLSGLPGSITHKDIEALSRMLERKDFTDYWFWLMVDEEANNALQTVIETMPQLKLGESDRIFGFDGEVRSKDLHLRLDNEMPNNLYELAREWIR